NGRAPECTTFDPPRLCSGGGQCIKINCLGVIRKKDLKIRLNGERELQQKEFTASKNLITFLSIPKNSTSAPLHIEIETKNLLNESQPIILFNAHIPYI
ncbi:unnamed protein product, partial [Didymodactylos carnosus]